MAKIKKVDWMGLKHEAVAQHFDGNPIFCNYFCVKGEYLASAVYYCPKPNLAKGHKEYMLLQQEPLTKNMFVRGMTAQEIEPFRLQAGILCLVCGTALYSINRHHANSCECPNEAFVDGGRDYIRAGAKDMHLIKGITIDLLTDEVIGEDEEPLGAA